MPNPRIRTVVSWYGQEGTAFCPFFSFSVIRVADGEQGPLSSMVGCANLSAKFAVIRPSNNVSRDTYEHSPLSGTAKSA
jgi:hypothetical protein